MIINLKKEYKEAFCEVNEIIQLMPDELINKIPSQFRKMIEEEREKTYNPNIQEPLEKQKLKNETIIILGLIYRDFLCSPEERKQLQEKDAIELQEVQQKLEEETRQKYNIDNILKKNEKELQIKQENQVAIVEYKESILKRIINKIKAFFRK